MATTSWWRLLLIQWRKQSIYTGHLLTASSYRFRRTAGRRRCFFFLLLISVALIALSWLAVWFLRKREREWRAFLHTRHPSVWYDRCLDLKFDGDFFCRLQRDLHTENDWISEETARWHSHFCGDLHGTEADACPVYLLDHARYVNGDIVYRNIYSPDTIQLARNRQGDDQSGPYSLPIQLEMVRSVVGLTEASLVQETTKFSIGNPARKEVHWRHLNTNADSLQRLAGPLQLIQSPPDRPIPTSLYSCPRGLEDGCRLSIVTYSTSCNRFMNQFVQRTLDDGIFNITILGLHTPWKGFGHRIRTLKNYLKSVPAEKVIMWVDATDVGFLPTCRAESMVEAFRSYSRSPILFLGETACWPDKHLAPQFPVPDHKPDTFRYLNAGLSIGYAWAYLDMLEEYDNRGLIADCSDDQRFWSGVFLKRRSFLPHPTDPGSGQPGRTILAESTKNVAPEAIPYIQIDYHQVLFQSLRVQPVTQFDFTPYASTGRIVFRESGGRPCGFHQHGHKDGGVPEHLNDIFERIDTLSEAQESAADALLPSSIS